MRCAWKGILRSAGVSGILVPNSRRLRSGVSHAVVQDARHGVQAVFPHTTQAVFPMSFPATMPVSRQVTSRLTGLAVPLIIRLESRRNGNRAISFVRRMGMLQPTAQTCTKIVNFLGHRVGYSRVVSPAETQSGSSRINTRAAAKSGRLDTGVRTNRACTVDKGARGRGKLGRRQVTAWQSTCGTTAAAN
uniref:Uncharacterized protein n=1 Tax=Toxoplasma gondii TgCATBr9 TaxID=943120 RepID=A0A2T6IL19_TOXGO|nr:hypothetical protein TGBR9_383810 [Toxoplasma gondii TgCATBr9]